LTDSYETVSIHRTKEFRRSKMELTSEKHRGSQLHIRLELDEERCRDLEACRVRTSGLMFRLTMSEIDRLTDTSRASCNECNLSLL
jgi:hypothetical protein